jgi:transposase
MLTQFQREFPDDDACLEHLWRTRNSPDGEHAHCPRCDCRRVFKRYETKQQRQSWTCTGCGHHLLPRPGRSSIAPRPRSSFGSTPCTSWRARRCGISAKQLERELGVRYKTAWRIFNKIRNELMNEGERAQPLKGDIEIDETSWGGRPRRRLRTGKEQAEWREAKTTVLGMVERGGRIKLRVIKSRRGEPLSGAVRGAPSTRKRSSSRTTGWPTSRSPASTPAIA